MSKYRAWKRWAKRMRCQYDALKYRPMDARAFCPPDWTPDQDAYPWIQRALDHMAIGYGGDLAFPPYQLKIAKTLEVKSRGVSYHGLVAPQIVPHEDFPEEGRA